MNLDLFINKVCTILTNPINFNGLNQIAMNNIFVGRIEAIDENGVLVASLVNQTKSYFNMKNIVGILEEEVVTKDDPRVAKLSEKITLEKLESLI